MKKASLTRREFLGAAAMSSLAAAAVSQAPRPGATPPNFVFIMADDMGYADLSCYGRREYRTTNIDRLAAQGMKFMQAYANSSVCSNTRLALITGRYQYRLPAGLEEPIMRRNVGLPPDHPTLPSLLRKVGYSSTLVGKWHLGSLPDFSPLKSGYEHFWGFRGAALDYFTHKSQSNTDDLWDDDAKVQVPGYLTDLLGDRAVRVISEYARVRKPFLLSLHFNAPHFPFEGPGDEEESKRFANNNGDFNTYDHGSLDTYGRMVRELDTQIGRVLQQIEASGIANNTIVVFTSDNGGERYSDTWPFTGKKTELLEGGLRIPAIVRWPGRVHPGSTTTQVAMSMDWMPTFLAAAATQPDPGFPLDGMNLLPALLQSAAPVPRKVFWRYRANGQQAMRDGDMKYLKIAGNTFLFNVVNDPLERANLRTRMPDVFAKLVDEYAAWNSTLLPEDPNSNSARFTGPQLADHYGSR